MGSACERLRRSSGPLVFTSLDLSNAIAHWLHIWEVIANLLELSFGSRGCLRRRGESGLLGCNISNERCALAERASGFAHAAQPHCACEDLARGVAGARAQGGDGTALITATQTR